MRPWLHLFLDIPELSWDAARAFWASALGCSVSPARGEDGQFATLVPPSGRGWVKLQRVAGAGGVHLDVNSRDPGALRRRALALGASPAWRHADVEVLRSPGGLLLCATSDAHAGLSRDGECVLDQGPSTSRFSGGTPRSRSGPSSCSANL